MRCVQNDNSLDINIANVNQLDVLYEFQTQNFSTKPNMAKFLKKIVSSIRIST